MTISLPELSLVVLIGPSGAGKSTFARKHFKPTEVLSSDVCRGLVSDNESDQAATNDAFEILHAIAAKRLTLGRLTVVDATNVQPEARRPLVALARRHYCLPVAIVFNLSERLCQERNRGRSDRDFGPHVIRQQIGHLRRSLRGLPREGFRHVFVLKSAEEVAAAVVERVPPWNNRKTDLGPFDIVGDVHGCCDELEQLLSHLGYAQEHLVAPANSRCEIAPLSSRPNDVLGARSVFRHPAGRKAVFIGDLVDRGPRILDTVRLVHDMVVAGSALCLPGNHDMKLLRKLRGKDVRVTHGLENTLAEVDALPEAARAPFRDALAEFLDSLVSHYVLDQGRLVVAHAGLKEEMHGRAAGKVREFALYGETTGETDEFGLPVRQNWAADYRGRAAVVYGHTPVPESQWLNNTINIDTGCVFGGKLTALRWPERELVSIPAARVYREPARPLYPADSTTARPLQHQYDDLLDVADVLGKRIINTRLQASITIRAENAAAALEVMSRFAANPKWLIYLPPTMSPTQTSLQTDLLEHPAEGFSYYREQGIPRVICQQKHMGSRAVVIICRDEAAAQRRFGVADEGIGICYTRTGRRFFDSGGYEPGLLTRVRSAMDRSGLWDELKTDWICLDCELMPWSAKAQALLQEQYAAVGTAAQAALSELLPLLQQTAARIPDASAIADRFAQKAVSAAAFVDSYRAYCWPVHSLDDLKLAPFHILASENAVHAGRDHLWHMDTLRRLCEADSALLMATPYQLVDTTDSQSESAAAAWWSDLTARGGEGMVIKPLSFIAKSRRGLAQPAVKCRGHEYLRIIYGPDYTAPENLDRLRSRGLGLTQPSHAPRASRIGGAGSGVSTP